MWLPELSLCPFYLVDVVMRVVNSVLLLSKICVLGHLIRGGVALVGSQNVFCCDKGQGDM